MKINSFQINAQLARKNMTRIELAKKSGILPQNISTIINRGSCEPRTAGKIARALNVDVEDLIVKEGVS